MHGVSSFFDHPELLGDEFYNARIVLGDRHLIRAYIEGRIEFTRQSFFYASMMTRTLLNYVLTLLCLGDQELIRDIMLDQEQMPPDDFDQIVQLTPSGLRFLHYNYVSATDPEVNLEQLHSNLLDNPNTT